MPLLSKYISEEAKTVVVRDEPFRREIIKLITAFGGGSTTNFVPLDEKGVPYGVATLDANGKVPIIQLPASVVGDIPNIDDVLGQGGVLTDDRTISTDIYNLTFVGDIRLTDGNEGIGKVLTSDADGKFTWQSPSGYTEGTGIDITGTTIAVDTTFISTISYVDSQLSSKQDVITATTTADYYRGDKTFATLNTTAVPEGTRLYYTDARFDTRFATKSTTNLTEGTNLYYTATRFNTAFAAKNTDNLTEGTTNKYFSNTLARASISAGTGIGYNSTTGVITNTGIVTETDPIFTASPAAGISSTNITRWTAAYDDKIISAAFTGTTTKTLTLTQQDGGTITATFADTNTTYTAGTGLSLVGTTFNNTGVITETDPVFTASPAFGISAPNITNWTTAYNKRIVSAAFTGTTTKTLTITLGDATTVTADFTDDNTGGVTSVNGQTGTVVLNTDNVSEGSTNFYYTSSRFNTSFATKTTDNLTEGSTNLYFTTARARASFSAGTGITIVGGVISATGSSSQDLQSVINNGSVADVSVNTFELTDNTASRWFSVNPTDQIIEIGDVDAITTGTAVRVNAHDNFISLTGDVISNIPANSSGAYSMMVIDTTTRRFEKITTIPNNKLTNSTISGVSLGNNLNTLTISSPLTGTSYNGSSAISIGIQDASADGTTKGAATFTSNDFNATSGVISIDYTNGQAANSSQGGFLKSSDWNTFNNKYSGLPSQTGNSGKYLTTNGSVESWATIVGLTDGDKGDITVASSGTAWTIDNSTITIPKISATGTASSSTYLRGDGSWSSPSGSGDVVGPAIATDNAIVRFDLTTGKLLQNSNTLITDGGSLIFTGQTTQAYSQGQLYYDTADQCLTFYNNDSAVGLQIGQEEWIRVINNTGSTIGNGVPIYISGATSGVPSITPANASAATTTICAGLTTESIANGAIGYVTCLGLVRGVNTSGFTAGSTVYLGTTAGTLTSTAPTAPNYRYRVGIVGVSDATNGTIHVTPSTAALGNGTANQIFGINNGGTAQEVKTLTTATSGTDFAIANTTNTITFNLPTASASNRGAFPAIAGLTTGDLLSWNGTTFSRIAASATSGQVLTSTGAGSAPTYQAAGGSVTNRTYRYVSSLIDFKTVATTTIFTTEAALGRFIVEDVYVMNTVFAGFSTGIVFNLGWTASAYSDYGSTLSINNQPANLSWKLSGNSGAANRSSVPASTAFRINVTTGWGATTATGYIVVVGFYLSN